MTIQNPFIKFSTFPYCTPIQFVIIDLALAEEYRHAFVKHYIFFPDDKKRKTYEIIFPKYKFLNEYLKYPVRERVAIGGKNILIEAEKEYGSQFKIHKIARFQE